MSSLLFYLHNISILSTSSAQWGESRARRIGAEAFPLLAAQAAPLYSQCFFLHLHTCCQAHRYSPSSSVNRFAQIIVDLFCWPLCSKDFYLETYYLQVLPKQLKQTQTNKTSPRMKDQLFFSVWGSACLPSTISQVETAALSCKKKIAGQSQHSGATRITHV